MVTLKQLTHRNDGLAPGHRLCAGCAASIVVRQVLMASDKPVIAGSATGCLEVATTIYPFSAWRIPWIHNAFENVAATITGVETMYRALKKQGKYGKDVNFVAFGGDGGTYDIGIQALSGALERGHRFVYVCYDNQAYMNTGIQRSGATPFRADTTTCPAGKVIPGKPQHRKDLAAIVAAHNIPYVAQCSPHDWRDVVNKAEKAFAADGPAFLNILSPCHRGWRIPMETSLNVAKMAVETCFWPLFEVVDGKWTITYKPKKKVPVVDWLKLQGRYSHVMQPGNEHLIEEFQAEIDKQWEKLLAREGCSV
ncbi:MAG: pyruvate ferredoxin oxidoreductase [Candidatus Coatesbacteria bacterium]|nr:pyruvate ferredoxin oxidoreductase [Candidatus Coatesbacteria bacterium]